MNLLRRSWETVRNNLKVFVMMNVFYFSLVGTGMAYGAWNTQYGKDLLNHAQQGANEVMPMVVDAYAGGKWVKAVSLTFVINLVAGTLLFISLPSLVVPFAGIVAGAIRAVLWGILFTPSFSNLSGATVLYGLGIGLLMLLEGEGYVVAMGGTFLQGRSLLLPATAGADSRWQGYKCGLVQHLRLYPLIAIVLLVAAIYEMSFATFLAPLLK